jgi:hypothetical protein
MHASKLERVEQAVEKQGHPSLKPSRCALAVPVMSKTAHRAAAKGIKRRITGNLA